MAHAPATMRGQSALLLVMLVLMVLYTVYLAQDVLAPLVLAVLLNLLLSPVVARLRQFGLPEPLGAGLVVVGLLGGLGWGFYALSTPAMEWVAKAPQNLAEISDKVRALKAPVEEMRRTTEKVEEMARVDNGPTVKVEQSSWTAFFVVGTTQLVAQGFVVVVLLYFLLAAGDLFMRRFVKALSKGSGKRHAVEIVRAVQRDVTTYLGTVSLINVGLGVATGAAMAAIGMPNPVLWGVVAAVFNFVPYAGSAVTIVVLGFVGMMTFDDLTLALLAPGIFFVLTNIEANLVTPVLLGGRLTLNPALVFVSLVVWSWMWGVAGAVLAVPLLVTLKAFADHLPSWNGISIFLGRRD